MNRADDISRNLQAAMAVSAALFLTLLLLVWGAFNPLRTRPVKQTIVFVVTAWLVIFCSRKVLAWMGRNDVFHPAVAFPVAFALWFTIGSIDVITLPSSFSFGLFDPMPYWIYLYAGIGLLGYLAGVWMARTKSESHPAALPLAVDWRPGVFQVLIGGLSAVTVASYLSLVASIGIPILSANPGEARLAISRHGMLQSLFFSAAWTLFLLLVGYIWQGQATRRLRAAAWLGVAGLAVLFLSLGGRGYLFSPVLTAVVMRNYLKGPLPIRKLAAIVLIMFLGASLFGFVRDVSSPGQDQDLSLFEQVGIPSYVVPFALAYLYIRYPVATLRDVITTIPAQVPYQLGAITTLPVQVFLPGRHEMSDIYFKNLLGNEFSGAGQPATLLGPFYADFGAGGIFVGMLLCGLTVGMFYKWMTERTSVFRVLIFAWVTHSMLFGLFATVVPYINTILLPMSWVVLHLFLRRQHNPFVPEVAST